LAHVDVEIPLTVTQEVLTYFPPIDEVSHRVGDMPVAIDYHPESPFYFVPQVEVPGMKVGWHHTGSEADPENREDASQEIIAGAQNWIDRLFPHLSREPIEVQTCLYTNTPDYHFVMDTHPEYEHIVMGAGFSGHGFKFGPVLGQFLAQMAQEQAPPISLEPFALKRFEDPDKLQKRVGA
jgi:glycine/D-amino acid oxidase-like deaminating enzyme